MTFPMFNIVDYGAVGDGETLNTVSIQAALAACEAAGGGTVLIPAGRFVSGSLFLPANTTLHLGAGAYLLGSTRLEDYPLDEFAWSVESKRAGLLSAKDVDNVTIEGRGVIDGSGLAFVLTDRFKQFEPAGADYDPAYVRQQPDGSDSQYVREQAPYDYVSRPGNMIRFLNCRNITIQDVTICNSPTWTVHVKNSQVVNISRVFIHSYDSDRRVPNDDGIDINGCDDVHVTDCTIHTGDDCLVVFGGQRITAANCTLVSRSCGIRVGWLGPDIKDVVFQNLVIHANRGIGVFVRGPGSIENVSFSHILIRTQLFAGHWWGKGEALQVSALPSRPDLGRLGSIRGVRFNDIVAEAQSGIVVHGCEESSIRDVNFNNVDLKLQGSPMQAVSGGNLDLRPVKDLTRALFAHDIHGLYARFVDNLSVERFTLCWEGELPSYFANGLVCEDFARLTVSDFNGDAAPAVEMRPAVVLRRGRQAHLSRLIGQDGNAAALRTEDVSGLVTDTTPIA